MRSKLLMIVALLLVTVSLALFAYPNISKEVVQKNNDEIIEHFDKTAEDIQDGDRGAALEDGVINEDGYLIDDSGQIVSDYPVVFQKDLDRLYEDSVTYNEALKERQDMDVDFSDAALDLTDYGIYDGIYGYVKAPAIDLNIPIYLGASDGNMAWGASHLMNTSLPLGKESANTVLAGHTGYFGMIVFDYIPSLSVGDTVSVTTYFDTLDYRVISKKEITETETNDLYIEKGKDLLTLITCARMGKARYEVVCERP
ncbi:sortase [Ruminococcus sp.]|uniref:class C sortase n=1 Tax=Ruminococcus sp. TaxID=41978 RepID=UPI00388CF155